MEPVFHPLTWLWALPAWKEIIVKRQRRHTFINTSSSLYNQLPLYLLIIPFPPRGRAPHFYPTHWLLYQTGLYKFKFKSKSDNAKKKLSYLLTHLFSPLIILAQKGLICLCFDCPAILFMYDQVQPALSCRFLGAWGLEVSWGIKTERITARGRIRKSQHSLLGERVSCESL